MARITATLALALALILATAAPAAAQDRDCSDFDSQAEAQDFYENAGDSAWKGQRKELSMERCGANTKRGAVCGKPAGWGTNHPGVGRCKLHGGASPTHVKAAQRREAERAVELFGLPREVEPHEALLEEVWRTAGHVTWLGDVVGQLERNQVVHGITRTVQFRDGSRTVEARAAVNVWVKLYQEERDRLVRVARAAIVAGVEERQVRLAEGQAQQLAEVIRVILTDLGHDLADEHVSEVVSLTVALVAAFSCRGLRGAPSSLPPAPRRNGQHKSPTPAARRLEA